MTTAADQLAAAVEVLGTAKATDSTIWPDTVDRLTNRAIAHALIAVAIEMGVPAPPDPPAAAPAPAPAPAQIPGQLAMGET